jgi:hypothetical protein
VIVSVIDRNNGQSPLSFLPEASPDTLVKCMTSLDDFLCTTTPDTSVLPVTSKIISPKITRDIIKRGYRLFLSEYKKIHDSILDPANKYEFPSSIVKRSVHEVETLLGVDLRD